jgi:DNA-binding transcriptional LysR family regulator
MQGIHQGHLTLAVMDSHSTGFVPAFLKEVARKHARISLTIEVCSPDDALAALVGDRVDLAAVFNAPPRRDLHVLWQQELPFGCVVAPDHPLARAGSVSLQEVCAHPIALQSKALVIRRYLESHYSWLLNDLRSTVETNSLQLVKMLVRDNGYAAFTSELDAAPELAQGSLVFVPVRDKGVEPQTVSLLMAAAKPMSPMVKVVANGMQAHIIAALEAARA